MREADCQRKTLETDIHATLRLDGKGDCTIQTGIPFFDHMLCAFAKHAVIDLSLSCSGDLCVDGHHTVEDCAIVLGTAIAKALGDHEGIARVGHAYVPMDEALAFCALDASNRPYLSYHTQPMPPMIGLYDTQLTIEFFRAIATHGGLTLHLKVEGDNAHHMTEAMFKAFGRALRMALTQDQRVIGIPSTKGVI